MIAGSADQRHVTVMLQEAVDLLDVRSDGIYVDGTFGRGGHSRAIVGRLGARGRLIALDRDPLAVEEGRRWADSRFEMVHGSFSELRAVLEERGVAGVDGILLDLGVSSPQLDEGARGFSFRQDGPLDMRMDTTRGRTAADWLATATESEMAEVIRGYGEERYAKQIARAIAAARAGSPLATTRQLAEIVAKAVKSRERHQDPATRTFQAIRIFINQELEELSLVLPQALDLLNPGGRLAVISFHSLEDRMVKHALRDAVVVDTLPRDLPIRHRDLPVPRFRLVGKAVRPSDAEVAVNPRARSATLRVVERLEGAHGQA